MLIQNTSIITGKVHTLEVNVTHRQIALWQSGVNIQEAMPHLSVEDREFLISGTTPEEWNDAFGIDGDELAEMCY